MGKYEDHRASSPCSSGDQVCVLERPGVPTAATRILPPQHPPPKLLHSSKPYADIADIAFVSNTSVRFNVKLTFSVLS